MTYNFDAERWWDRELNRLQQLRDRGDLDDEAYGAALTDLERRLDEMTSRLDGSFRVTDPTDGTSG